VKEKSQIGYTERACVSSGTPYASLAGPHDALGLLAQRLVFRAQQLRHSMLVLRRTEERERSKGPRRSLTS